MGIFNNSSRTKSRAKAATLIARGCNVNGQLKIEGNIQIDGSVEGTITVEGTLTVAKSGYMSGNITAETLVVNGTVEGDCYVDQIQILSMGRVRGKIYSNNLTIEQGGQFFGETIELPNRANDETLLAEPPFDENAIEKLDDQSNSGDVKKTA